MSITAETQSPLVLWRKSELQLARIAAKRYLKESDPLIERLGVAVTRLGWADRSDPPATFEGQDELKIRRALLSCVVTEPSNSGQRWEQAEAALILDMDHEAPNLVDTASHELANLQALLNLA